MITIMGLDIDFDMTNPDHILRLHEAQEVAAQKEADIPDAPTDKAAPDYLVQYARWLQSILKTFGDFIDDTFGDGIAEKLLTNSPSVTRMFDVNDALDEALGDHVKTTTARFNKYQPNRAARRAKK